MAADVTLTDAQLAEIEAREKAATPGPWEVPPFGVNGGEPWRNINGPQTNIIGNYDTGGIGSTKADSDFIAHARADVPALIAALRASRTQLAKIGEWAHPDGIDAECYLCGEVHGRNPDTAARDAECPCPAHDAALGVRSEASP